MRIIIIHGPNLNKLGQRDQNIYGSVTQENLFQTIIDSFPNISFTFFQSNHEGELIDLIQTVDKTDYEGLIINPAGYTHTSVAIRDALDMVKIPKVEVHLSDIEAREPFRQIDVIKDVCDQRFMGKKVESYIEAVRYLENVCRT